MLGNNSSGSQIDKEISVAVERDSIAPLNGGQATNVDVELKKLDSLPSATAPLKGSGMSASTAPPVADLEMASNQENISE